MNAVPDGWTREAAATIGDAPVRPNRRIPFALLGALVLIAWTELGYFHDSLAFQSSHAASWRFGPYQAKRSAPGCDILCFGDSLVKFGLIPAVLSAETGLRAYNLALFGGPPPGTCLMLHRALEAGTRPSIAIVDFSADFLSDKPSDWRRAYPWADLLTLSESIELCWRARDAELFAKITLGRLFHSIKSRNEVRESLIRYLHGLGDKYRGESVVLYRNWNKNRGAMIRSQVAGTDTPPPPSTTPRPATWTCVPPNEHYVTEFLDLTLRHGIRVYWLRPPVSPAQLRHVDLSGNEGRVEAFIQSLLRKYPHMVCVDGQRSGYPRTAFCDNVHLNTDGAQALSASMAAVIRHAPRNSRAETRWISLPEYLEPTSRVAVEDLDHSLEAVRSRGFKSRR